MADANIPLVARIMVQHGGAGSGPTGTNDARRQSKNMESVQKSSAETSKNSSMSLGKMIGIFAGVGLIFGFVYKMFKNSQVTKSVFGAIFKILGAMVDVFLAPFVPYIIPLLDEMISWLDPIAEFGEKVAMEWMPILIDKVRRFAQIVEEDGFFVAVKKALMYFAGILKDIIVNAILESRWWEKFWKGTTNLGISGLEWLMGQQALPGYGLATGKNPMANTLPRLELKIDVKNNTEQEIQDVHFYLNGSMEATLGIPESGSMNRDRSFRY